MKRRARLTDENDPLTPTDKVLARFERVSQSGTQEVGNTKGQKVSQIGSREVSNLTVQNANNLESQEFNKLSSEHTRKSEIQEVGKSTIQQVEKLNLRKSTFQLNQAILDRLDTFHLQLQLELGKANAPYKEVIVEEAIAQLLDEVTENRIGLLAALQARQDGRT